MNLNWPMIHHLIGFARGKIKVPSSDQLLATKQQVLKTSNSLTKSVNGKQNCFNGLILM